MIQLNLPSKAYNIISIYNILFFLIFYLFIYLERRKGQEKDWERNINVWLSLARPQLGAWAATQACALTAIFWFTGRHSTH